MAELRVEGLIPETQPYRQLRLTASEFVVRGWPAGKMKSKAGTNLRRRINGLFPRLLLVFLMFVMLLPEFVEIYIDGKGWSVAG